MNRNQDRFTIAAATVPGVLYEYVLYPDGSSRYLYVGPGSEEVLELKETDLMRDSMLFLQIVHPDDLEGICEADRKANDAGTLFSHDCRIITPSGQIKWIHITSRPLPQDKGDFTTWFGIVTDITKHKQIEAELRQREKELIQLNQKLTQETVALQKAYATISHIAATDGLTQLASRRHFYESLHKAISAANRHNTPLTLVSFDLDGLKPINDTAGHAAGDEVLRAFGGVLHAEIRKEDIAGRLGGDEFSVILLNTTIAAGQHFAQRVAKAVGVSPPLYSMNVTSSAGIAQLEVSETADGLVSRADMALYRAKRAGKGLISVAATRRDSVQAQPQTVS